jgi:uncharacterized Fe-S cluster-containing radical SAM superfamily enzyme
MSQINMCPKCYSISGCTCQFNQPISIGQGSSGYCQACMCYHIGSCSKQASTTDWSKFFYTGFKKLEDYTNVELESELQRRKDKNAKRAKEIAEQIEKLKVELDSLGG